jgi:hypothetical protein
MEFKVT